MHLAEIVKLLERNGGAFDRNDGALDRIDSAPGGTSEALRKEWWCTWYYWFCTC
jgi:hypothetical protein